MTEKLKTITVGELRHELEKLLTYPDDTEIYFGSGNLTFQRLKTMRYRDADRSTPAMIGWHFLEDYSLD